jgi:hypothetical protein
LNLLAHLFPIARPTPERVYSSAHFIRRRRDLLQERNNARVHPDVGASSWRRCEGSHVIAVRADERAATRLRLRGGPG